MKTLEQVHVVALISGEAHSKLKEKADDRGIFLQTLNARILEWAGDKDVRELAGLGIRIPVFPDELEKGTGTPEKSGS